MHIQNRPWNKPISKLRLRPDGKEMQPYEYYSGYISAVRERHEDAEYHWEEVFDVWGWVTGTNKVIDHCWTKVEVTVQDVSGVSELEKT